MGCSLTLSAILESWYTSTISSYPERATTSCGSATKWQKYELKVQVAGWDRDDSRELQFLGRVIRLTQTGIELEGDDKHVGLMEKEWEMTHCNPVSTP